MVCYQDDMCLRAINEEELKNKLTLSWVNAGMTINENKSFVKSDKISFVGYSKKEVLPDRKNY